MTVHDRITTQICWQSWHCVPRWNNFTCILELTENITSNYCCKKPCDQSQLSGILTSAFFRPIISPTFSYWNSCFVLVSKRGFGHVQIYLEKSNSSKKSCTLMKKQLSFSYGRNCNVLFTLKKSLYLLNCYLGYVGNKCSCGKDSGWKLWKRRVCVDYTSSISSHMVTMCVIVRLSPSLQGSITG